MTAIVNGLAASFLYNCGRIILTILRDPTGLLPGKTSHKASQLQQIPDPKEGPPLPNGNFRIQGNRVGPLRRNGANRPVVNAQQQPLAGSVIPLPNANELLAAKRVERMRYPHKLRAIRGKARIPR
jgi:hypothetical protein